MKIYSNYSYSPVFSSSYKPKNSAAEQLRLITDIFNTPVENRSHHLIHELNPNDNKPISGRFKLAASDGSMLTVTKARSKDYLPVNYISISSEKNDVKRLVRIDCSNGRIIKSGLGGNDGIRYYSAKELAETGILKFIDNYLPDITKRDFVSPAPALKTAKIRRRVSEVDIDKIVKSVGEGYNPETPETSGYKVPATYVLTGGIPASVRKMSKIAAKHQVSEPKYFDEDLYRLAQNIEDSYWKFKDDIRGQMCNTIFDRFLRDERFSDIIDRECGCRSIILKGFDNDETAKVYIKPETSLLRISFFDKEQNPVRAYLIKNSEKLVKNYNSKHYNIIPASLKFVSEEEFDTFAPEIRQDMKKINKRLGELIEIAETVIEDYPHSRE